MRINYKRKYIKEIDLLIKYKYSIDHYFFYSASLASLASYFYYLLLSSAKIFALC